MRYSDPDSWLIIGIIVTSSLQINHLFITILFYHVFAKRWAAGWPSNIPLMQGWPHFFLGGQKNGPKKLGGQKNVLKIAWPAKFNLKKHNKCYNFFKQYNIQIQFFLTLYFSIKCFGILSTVYLTNVYFKKVQRALENVLAGTFLSPGSGLATPALMYNLILWNNFLIKKNTKIWECSQEDYDFWEIDCSHCTTDIIEQRAALLTTLWCWCNKQW